MTVKELRDILKDFDDDFDVMTKKTDYLRITSDLKEPENSYCFGVTKLKLSSDRV